MALHSSSATERARAAHALGGFGPRARLAIKPLIASLRDPVAAVREEAAFALGSIGAAGSPFLFSALGDATVTADSKRWASVALGQVVKRDPGVLTKLLELSKSSDPSLRALAIRALGASGAVAAVPRLIELLEGDDALARRDAACALGQIGPRAIAALPSFVRALRIDDRPLTRIALVALGSVGRGARSEDTARIPLVEALDGALQHADPIIRGLAARAMGELGAPAMGSAPMLIGLLADPAPAARDEGSRALRTLASGLDEPSILALVAAARAGSKPGRLAALEILGRVGPRARSEEANLQALTKERDPDLRRAAGEALNRIGSSPDFSGSP